MVKHIVCWRLKDEANGMNKEENAKTIKEKPSDQIVVNIIGEHE